MKTKKAKKKAKKELQKTANSKSSKPVKSQKRFEYLDHTADLKIRAYGKTNEQAFENVAIGATNFLTDASKVKPVIQKKIRVSSNRLQTLLYDFLEELLIMIDIDGFLFAKAKSLKISYEGFAQDRIYILECEALGDHYKNYKMKGDLKAVTYSEMAIEEGAKEVIITVVYDI